MPNSATSNPPGTTVDAVLIGGPADIPPEARTARIAVTGGEIVSDKVKLRHGNGYEHFERLAGTAAHDGSAAPVVFHWTMRTAIAE
ncbi:DUF5988 family protein [Streptomyces sp. NPDC055287]